MKKITLLFIMQMAIVMSLLSQDYKISFAIKDSGDTPTSVIVDNTTQNTSSTLNGDDILHLMSIPTGVSGGITEDTKLQVYPNPMANYSTVEFYNSQSGNVKIQLVDITGKTLLQRNKDLPHGRVNFTLSGLGRGSYILNITNKAQKISKVILSQSNSNENIHISEINSSNGAQKLKSSQDIFSTIPMNYTSGDVLKFTAAYGNENSVVENYIATSDDIIEFSFAPDYTGQTGTLVDIEGTNYNWVGIGSQVWMADNLRTTKYKDGSDIPLVTDNTSWENLSTPAYCWHDNDKDFAESNNYGALYNWYTVVTDKLCPDGWHVPSDNEWTILKDYLSSNGHTGKEGTALKTTSGWDINGNGTDDYGFSALPGGCRYNNSSFNNTGSSGYWWSSIMHDIHFANYHQLYYSAADMRHNYTYKSTGYSVRCVRD